MSQDCPSSPASDAPALPSPGGTAAFLFLEALDDSAIGILITDPQGRVVWMNRTLERYLGLPRAEAIGADRRMLSRWLDARLPGDSEAFVDGFRHVTGRSERAVVCVRNGAGLRRLEHWSCPVASGAFTGGQIYHFVDVTEPAPEPTRKASAWEVFDTSIRSILHAGK